MVENSFEEFKQAVIAARPDLEFTFQEGAAGHHNHEARWKFPGCQYSGGSVMWPHGSRRLSWGMASGDVDAWIAYEESCGRTPRWT